MEDLLSAFLGLDGKYCRAARVQQPDGAHVAYGLETDADPSLRELAARMLPIWWASLRLRLTLRGSMSPAKPDMKICLLPGDCSLRAVGT